MHHRIIRAGFLAATVCLVAAQADTFTFALTPVNFSSATDGPFYLDFTLIGTAGNTVSISSLDLGGGAVVTGTENPTGDISGNLSTVLTLSDDTGSFYNDFFEEFTPGSQIGFVVSTTGIEASTPDDLTLSVLDSSLLPVPTLDPTGANTLLTLTLGSSTGIAAYASDTSQSGNGVQYPDIPQAVFRPGTIQSDASTPEPSTILSSLTGVLILGAALFQSRVPRRKAVYGAKSLLWFMGALCVPSFVSAQCTPLSQSSGSPFQSPNPTASAQVMGITVADFDGDGIPDVAFGQAGLQTLTVMKGNGLGGFSIFAGGNLTIPTALLGTSDSVLSMVSGDFNHDGLNDLAVLTKDLNLFIAVGNGHGGFIFPATPSLRAPANTSQILATDLNHDGYTDLVTIGIGPEFALINTAGVIGTTNVSLGSNKAGAVQDVNGDGYPDVVFPNGTVDLNNQRGGFTSSTAFTPSASFAGENQDEISVIGDFDGDGKPDFLLVGQVVVSGNSLVAYQLFSGDGAGHFTAGPFVQTSVTSIQPATNVVAGDFNGDGRLDFAIEINNLPADVYVFQGVGAGSFAVLAGSPYATATTVTGDFLTVASLTSNGRPDILAGVYSTAGVGEMFVFLANSQTANLGISTSANPAVIGTPLSITAIVGGSNGCGTPTGEVLFSDNGTPLGTGTISNGIAGYTVSGGLASGIHTVTASYSGDGNFQPSAASYVEFVGASGCAVNETSQLTITPGGFVYDRVHGQFVQTVAVKNIGSSPLTGPLSLALDSLSSNVALVTPAGVTSCAGPMSSPYADLGLCPGSFLEPGGSITATLRFTDPSMKAITYTARVLAGLAVR